MKLSLAIRLSIALVLLLVAVAPSAGPLLAQDYDFIIRNGRVLDGSGNPWIRADIGVRGDRIAAIGDLRNARAAREIDARGLYVAPGFIDAHSHAGPGLATAELSHGRPLLAQGVTTVFVNPDGGGPVDLVRQRQDLLAHGLGVNVAQLVPHGSVRGAVLGMADRAPDEREMARMRELVRAGMAAGAYGLSSGPFYTPGSFSRTEELVELARIAAAHGGAYTSHIRDEGDYTVGLVAAVDEVIRVAREAELPGVVTHIKALGPRVWGFSERIVQNIERARAEGVEVFADQYPYEASSTGLMAALVPSWARAGGNDSLRAHFADPARRARLREAMVENLDRRGGAERIQFNRFSADESIEGRTLAAIATERGMHPIDVAMDLVQRGGGPGIVSFNMHEDDIRNFMRQPWTMTASDGDLVPLGRGVPHPRAYGAFSRKLRRYVVDEPVVDLAMAIRSMTHLPASVFRVQDRGMLRAGAFADIAVFDLGKVRDLATYDAPHQLSEGMVWVFVNGRPAVENGRFVEQRHGVVLNRAEAPASSRAQR